MDSEELKAMGIELKQCKSHCGDLKEEEKYVSCKNCQCEIQEKIANKYHGYCKNCYSGKDYISKDKK